MSARSHSIAVFGAALFLACQSRAATNDPVVHLMVPGFTVQELPVKLSNQNNLRFSPDGTLTSLGYDGRIWRLRDTNGDGLEDRAEPYWDRPTLSVPLGMAWSTAGLYVSSKGKVSLFRDTDADGRADVEEVVVSGWPVTDVGSGGVDATAVTLDREGNVYFGLLGADYSNAYRLRRRSDLRGGEVEWLKRNGRWREPVGPDSAGDEFSLYDLQSPRGTIQRWDPRTRKLDTWATGIRVPVALAFNREGDLFNTDQEGETWMPNGNPLDELNHIVRGRNYGFPPRHERWLPDLVSEAPAVPFGPQHQSACGLLFNEPSGKSDLAIRMPTTPLPVTPGQGLFGPEWWNGDAFVTGESRGKIWRVRFVKTPGGYIGKSYLIARLSMLTLDLAISPRGELYVCCHSGPPDWGTGPQGEGRIFKITYSDRTEPQPVAVWPAASNEVRVLFDRPLGAELRSAIEALKEERSPRPTSQGPVPTIEYGEYVSPGDVWENLKPPYEVVQQQDATPRGHLGVHSVRVDGGGRVLSLSTDTHVLAVNYVLSLPFRRDSGAGTEGMVLELGYDLNGGTALEFHDQASGWIPKVLRETMVSSGILNDGPRERVKLFSTAYPQTKAARRFGFGPDFEGRSKPRYGGRLQFRMHLPEDTSRLIAVSDEPFELERLSDPEDLEINLSSVVRVPAVGDRGAGYRAEIAWNSVPSQQHLWISGERGIPSVWLAFQREGAPREHPVPPSGLFMEWAPTNRASSGTDSRPGRKPDGDWQHGRELFASPKVNCVQCHRVRGEGGIVGPDLSNLVHRDPGSVLRDIRNPGATLHPDYVAYQAETRDGATHVGFLRGSSGDTVRLFDAMGGETTLQRTNVINVHPTGQSLMPSGLLDGWSETDIRDLLTFLLHEPPLRKRDEVVSALKAGDGEGAESLIRNPASARSSRGNETQKSQASKPSPGENQSLPTSPAPSKTGSEVVAPVHLVLVASKQDHGPGQHDYPAWQEKWVRLLSAIGGNTTVEKAWEWPTAAQWTSADVVLFYFWNHDWSPARYAEMDAYQERGGGLVFIHSAVIADQDPERLAERIGLSAQPGRSGYRHMPLELTWALPQDPLLRGLPERLPFLDEPYWPMIGNPGLVRTLATAEVEGQARPLVWTFERGRGRVFASVLGHYFWTLDDPLWRLLCLRGVAWAGRRDLSSFDAAVLQEAPTR